MTLGGFHYASRGLMPLFLHSYLLQIIEYLILSFYHLLCCSSKDCDTSDTQPLRLLQYYGDLPCIKVGKSQSFPIEVCFGFAWAHPILLVH